MVTLGLTAVFSGSTQCIEACTLVWGTVIPRDARCPINRRFPSLGCSSLFSTISRSNNIVHFESWLIPSSSSLLHKVARLIPKIPAIAVYGNQSAWRSSISSISTFTHGRPATLQSIISLWKDYRITAWSSLLHSHPQNSSLITWGQEFWGTTRKDGWGRASMLMDCTEGLFSWHSVRMEGRFFYWSHTDILHFLSQKV